MENSDSIRVRHVMFVNTHRSSDSRVISAPDISNIGIDSDWRSPLLTSADTSDVVPLTHTHTLEVGGTHFPHAASTSCGLHISGAFLSSSLHLTFASFG